MLLESCALETKSDNFNDDSALKIPYRTSSDSGSLSITSQSSMIKHQQQHFHHQIILNSSEHLDNDLNSESFMREENEMFSHKSSLLTQTKFNISSEIKPPLPVRSIYCGLLTNNFGET